MIVINIKSIFTSNPKFAVLCFFSFSRINPPIIKTKITTNSLASKKRPQLVNSWSALERKKTVVKIPVIDKVIILNKAYNENSGRKD